MGWSTIRLRKIASVSSKRSNNKKNHSNNHKDEKSVVDAYDCHSLMGIIVWIEYHDSWVKESISKYHKGYTYPYLMAHITNHYEGENCD